MNKTRPDYQLQATVTNSDGLRERLNQLHGSQSLSWRKIASLPEFIGVPAGTLCSFAKGTLMPKKYLHKFGLPDERPAPVCPTHNTIHLFDCQTQIAKPIPKPRKPRQPRNYEGKIWLY